MAMQGLPQRELAITHSVKNGHPPECLFFKTKSGCRFGGKVLIRTSSGLMNSRRKGSKTNHDKSAVAMLKKSGKIGKRESVSDSCHDRTGPPVKRSDKQLGQNSSRS